MTSGIFMFEFVLLKWSHKEIIQIIYLKVWTRVQLKSVDFGTELLTDSCSVIKAFDNQAEKVKVWFSFFIILT
jgi:hypothetical protein